MTPTSSRAGAARLPGQMMLGGLLTLATSGCTIDVDDAGRLPRPAVSVADAGMAPGRSMTMGPVTSGGDGCGTGKTCPPTSVAPPPCAPSATVVSGMVVAPTPPAFGRPDPLYNALVYVPTAPLEPFAPGVSCERCGRVSGAPSATALTAADGRFKLTGVTPGRDVPLVVQIGRWRRQVVIPEVVACAETVLPTELTRLPRNRSEGDIPRIALATGHYDPFDCTLRKIGIDESEFTLPGGDGRVNMWQYGGHNLGPLTPHGDRLVGDADMLAGFDIVILPCDDSDTKSPTLQKNLVDFANRGGRIFLTDFAFSWLRDGRWGDFQRTVVWKSWRTTIDLYQGVGNFTAQVDQEFPKGQAFSQWLTEVGATSIAGGQFPIHDPYCDSSEPFCGLSVVENVVPPTQRWIYTNGTTTGNIPSVQNFTFNAPIAAPSDEQCGRVVFSQFHVASDLVSDDPFNPAQSQARPLSATPTFPGRCNDNPMTPQEKALEFMLFDASSCVQPDWMAPIIP